MTKPAEFADRVFISRDEDTADFGRRVLEHVDGRKNLRVLDIGCGSGKLLFWLADKIGQGYFTGIDISQPNIDMARRTAENAAGKNRFDFICGDYGRWEPGKYDVIVARSTLQHIEDRPEALFGKIISTLLEGGILVYSMPYECFYNSLCYSFRRILRVFRGPVLDCALLSASKAFHGQDRDEDFLKQRLFYLYTLPRHTDGESLRGHLRRLGLKWIAEYPEAHRSPGQPKHKTAVFRKESAS